MVGQQIILDKSTISHEWYQIVKIEKIVMVENNTQRRLVYNDGTRNRGLINELYFNTNSAKAYKIKENIMF